MCMSHCMCSNWLTKAHSDVYICMYSFHWIEFMLNCNHKTGIAWKKLHVCRDVLCPKSQCERVSTTRKLILVQVAKSRGMLFWSIMWFQNCFCTLVLSNYFEGGVPNTFESGIPLYPWYTPPQANMFPITQTPALRQDLSQPLHSYEAQRETWAKKQSAFWC